MIVTFCPPHSGIGVLVFNSIAVYEPSRKGGSNETPADERRKSILALARRQDGPNRTYYVVIPYFATLIGGMASNLFFGPLAVMGYLVGGLGDAAGEPVGVRWGKHPYTITSGGAKFTKTYEGSLAVLAASVIALSIGVAISPQLHFDLRSLIVLPVIAIICTLVEAFSPRGWDNVPMQFVPTVLAAILMSK